MLTTPLQLAASWSEYAGVGGGGGGASKGGSFDLDAPAFFSNARARPRLSAVGDKVRLRGRGNRTGPVIYIYIHIYIYIYTGAPSLFPGANCRAFSILIFEGRVALSGRRFACRARGFPSLFCGSADVAEEYLTPA
jgi:hypothetical protein